MGRREAIVLSCLVSCCFQARSRNWKKKKKKRLVSFFMYVWSSAWNSSAPTERIFTKFGIWGLIENLSRKFKFHGNPTRITRTLHKVQFTFLIISHSVLLRMVHVSDRFIEKIKTHILCSVTFPGKSCRLWDNVEKYGTARQATDNKAAHSHCLLNN